MKKKIANSIILTFCFITAMGQFESSPTVDCDIIQAKYYHRVADALVNYYSGLYSKAYDTLKVLDGECGLGNSAIYQETYHYALLSVQLNECETALNSIQRLICSYGYKLSDFKSFRHFSKLKNSKQWKSFQHNCEIWEKEFVSDTSVFLLVQTMIQNDQNLRNEYRDSSLYYRNDTNALSDINSRYSMLIDSLDNTNARLLLSFLSENKDKKIKLSKEHRQSIYFSLLTVITHCANQSEIYDTLLSVIKEGIVLRQLPPEYFAALVDRKQLNNDEECIYGFYDNINCDEIIGFQNIDERRLAIGLTSYTVEKRLKAKRAEHYQSQR